MDQGPFTELPANLPVPVDDGSCRHLPGRVLPEVALAATSGASVFLCHRPGRTVVYAYPMTGRPGVPLPAGWDEIPGARGCTPQSCAFRDHYDDLRSLGVAVFGLSTQASDYQQEVRDRLHLPFDLLSDANQAFTDALALPTLSVDGRRLLRRFTLVCRDGIIEHVFYPVFPPDRHAAEVITWLQAHPQ